VRTLIFLFLFLLIPVSSYSETIEKIEIYGLKWTKEKFVRRELLFKEGDEFSEEKLKKSIRNLLNTHLFYRIVPEINKKNEKVTVKLKIKERFPIVPIPKFRIKTDESFRTGVEVRDYNLRGMGHHLFVGYTRWFKNENGERNAYLYSKFYRVLEDKVDIGAGVNFYESHNNNFVKDGTVIGKYDLKILRTNFYLTKYLDAEKIHRITAGLRPEFIRYSDWIRDIDEYYVDFSYTIDKTTDMVYYTKGSFFYVYAELAEPTLSSVFTGRLIASYSNSIRRREVDTITYGISAGTKVGYSGNGFILNAGIPGYTSEKVGGKRFLSFNISYRMAVIGRSVFLKPTIAGGDAFSSKPDDLLLSPGMEIEAFWAKLVDGIIRFRIFKGIGNGSDTQTSLKFGFRW
jgi:outer membrane protein assembly factor BamA